LFLGAIGVLILTAATYNNNLIFILGFFMFALFVVVLLQTHYNVKGVRLQFKGAEEAFAGDPLGLYFEITQKRSKWKRNLQIRTGSRKFKSLARLRVDLSPHEPARPGRIEIRPLRRGLFPVPDLILETYYPLGLFRAWKVFRVKGEFTVYPAPIETEPLSTSPLTSGQEELGLRTSPEGDFGELRTYRPGESYHQVAWKHFARTRELYTKVHWGEDHRHYIIPPVQAGKDLERQLSVRAQWVQNALDENATFEMIDEEDPIESGQGLDQARKCWRKLASVRRPV
jgi:uncharacterized protein (DUF58 family)